jgi:hypothetical protein
MWVGAVGSVVVLSATAIGGPGPHPTAVDYVGTSVFGLLMGLGFVRGVRMRVELDEAGVTAYNYVTTRRVPWHELAAVDADYVGLRLVRNDGSVVTATGVGKPNWATWLHRRVLADDAVDRIRLELARREPDGHQH